MRAAGVGLSWRNGPCRWMVNCGFRMSADGLDSLTASQDPTASTPQYARKRAHRDRRRTSLTAPTSRDAGRNGWIGALLFTHLAGRLVRMRVRRENPGEHPAGGRQAD